MQEKQKVPASSTRPCTKCTQPIKSAYNKCSVHKYCKACKRKLKNNCPCDQDKLSQLIKKSTKEEEVRQEEKNNQEEQGSESGSSQHLNPENKNISIIEFQEQNKTDSVIVIQSSINSSGMLKQPSVTLQKFQQMKQQYQQKNQKLRKKISNLSSLRLQMQNDYQKKLSQIHKKYEILQQQNKSFSDKIKILQSKQSQVIRQKQSMNQQIKDLLQKIIFLQNKQGQIFREKQSMNNQIKEHSQKIVVFQNKQSSALMQKESMNNQIKSHLAKILSLQNKCEQALRQKQALNEEIALLSNKNAQLIKQKEIVTTQISDLSNKVEILLDKQILFLREKEILNERIQKYQDAIGLLKIKQASAQHQKIVNQNEMTKLNQQIIHFKLNEENQRQKRKNQAEHYELIKKIINDYYNMLVNYFEEINSNFSYGLALEKIKMVKSLIQNFETVMTVKSPLIEAIISDHKPLITKYITNDLKQFGDEISKMEITFELFNTDKIKIILQKLKLYKEITEEKVLQMFEDTIAKKINHFLEKIVHKNLNNIKKTKNQFRIIEYLNKYLIFQVSLENEIQIVYEKCSVNLNMIRSNLYQNFKSIQNMFGSLNLDKPEIVKKFYQNEKSINNLIRLIISIRIIMKSQRYLLQFEKHTKRKINEFTDQINKKLDQMRKSINKQIQNIEVVNNYEKNYTFLKSLTKMKDFDHIWQDQQNFYYNFKFTELYQTVSLNNKTLKDVKVHQIHQMIGQDKINFQQLSQQIDIIEADSKKMSREILNVLICRIKTIFTYKANKLQRINDSSINSDFLQRLIQFYKQVTKLQEIVKGKFKFEKNVETQNYLSIIQSKIPVIITYLQKRLKYFLDNNQGSNQIFDFQKQLSQLISFQQFFKENFASQYKQLRKSLKEIFKPSIQQENIFFSFDRQKKQFIQKCINSQIIQDQVYDDLKKFRKFINKKQKEKIDQQIQKDIKNKIDLLEKEYWPKGIFDSELDQKVKVNISFLSNNLRQSLHQKYEKLKGQRLRQRQIQFQKNIQQKGNNYIIQSLIPLIEKQNLQKTIDGQFYSKILQEYLINLLQKQFKEVSKRKQFIQQYIHKIKHSLKSKQLKKLYEKLQYRAFRIQNPNMPSLIKSISQSLLQQALVSKKTQQNIEQLNQMINLHKFYYESTPKKMQRKKTKDSLKELVCQSADVVIKYLTDLNKKILNLQMNINFQQEKLMMKIINIQIIIGISQDISKIVGNKFYVYDENKLKALNEQIKNAEHKIKKFNQNLKQAVNEIHNYSFDQPIGKKRVSDEQILGDLLKKDVTFRNLIIISDFSQKNEHLLKKFARVLKIGQIKYEDLAKHLQLSWKYCYEKSIKRQLSRLFKIDEVISPILPIFIKIKNIVAQKRIKLFHFVTNQNYDLKRYILQEAKRMFIEVKKGLSQWNNEHGQYSIEIKQKKKTVKIKEQQQKKRIKLELEQYQQKYLKKHKMNNILIDFDDDQQTIKKKQSQHKQNQQKLKNFRKSKEQQLKETLEQFKYIVTSLKGLQIKKNEDYFLRVANNLRLFQKLSEDFPNQQEIIQSMNLNINEIFKTIQKLNSKLFEQFLQKFFGMKTKCDFAANIIAKIDLFKYCQLKAFNDLTKHQDINYVVNNCPQISSNNQLKIKILNDFEIYNKEVQDIQQSYKKTRNLEITVNRTVSQAINLSPPILLGRIFGVQSILRVKNKQRIKFLRNPHPSQIAAILLLIQPNNQNKLSQISNGMAQVKTGEGKSVVLAGLCCYLALKGFYAYCACYSSYLSKRDEAQYHSLFQTFNVLNKVVYGTFADHCKGLLDEKNGFQFKNVIKQCFINKNEKIDNKYLSYLKRLEEIFQQKDSIKRVLIIDEVDVFFQERYFGQYYRPAISLQNQNIKDLIKFIWQKRHLCKKAKQKQQLKMMIKSQYFYKELISEMSYLQSFFQNQLEGMIIAANDPGHQYQIADREIVYRSNGVIDKSLNNGYKTVFSACSLIEKKTITQQFYNKALKISVIISEFSYAELPKYFTNILGVSGTLQNLSKSRKEIMRQKYNINKFYILPSIYGETKRILLNPIVINKDYNIQLLNKIMEYTETGRPVLVFFNNKMDMINYLSIEQVKKQIPDFYSLSEDQDDSIRDKIIKQAGKRPRVTFLTSYFSRGTDFILQNEKLLEAGGFHVIQTYISKDHSDHVQVYGRTARQGKKGSFQMVVKEELFTQYNIKQFESTTLMGQIIKAWNLRDQIDGQKLKQKIIKAKNIHDKSFNIIKSLSKGSKSQLIKEVEQLNLIEIDPFKNIKSVIVIDGTSSMSKVLQKVKEVLKIAIRQTEVIIEEKNVNASFQQQIMIYRNYNSEAYMLECSDFMSDSLALTDWVGNIQAFGGWGNEAIEVAYSKINSQEDVNQIIIIGDARCNTKQEMLQKRNEIDPSPQFWSNIGIPFVQSPQSEVQKIILSKIPIHSLYILTTLTNKGVQEYFTEISTKTKGICKQFKIHDGDAGKILANFIAENVLNQIGGQKLVAQYKMHFG